MVSDNLSKKAVMGLLQSRKDTTMEKKFISGFAILHKRGYRVALGGLLLAIALTFAVFSHLPAAHAGTNGQHITIRAADNSAYISGPNQNGDTTSECVTNNQSDWWWEGTVTVSIFSSSDCSGSAPDSLTCNVPVDQGSDDYYVFDFTSHSCYAG